MVQRLKDYDLTRDDWEDLIELNYYSGRVPVLSKIETKVRYLSVQYDTAQPVALDVHVLNYSCNELGRVLHVCIVSLG